MVEKSALTPSSREGLTRNGFIIAAKIDGSHCERPLGVAGRAPRAAGTSSPAPRPSPLTVLGQVLGHQETDQVTRASAAWPLRPGWKKSRVLTWLALNR